jgi:hypothetical protein
MSQTLYSGPAKVSYYNANSSPQAMQAEGENGAIKITIDEKTTQRSTAMHGRILETLDDVTAKIDITPFDSWTLLPTLFPAYLGVTCTTGGTTGALVVGTRPHTYVADVNGLNSTKIWTPDGRLYNFVRTAITKHPDLKLGPGMPLFGGIEIMALGDPAKNPGDTSFLVSGNAITESAATDPTASSFQDSSAAPDFINGKWTGAWGSVTGFTSLEGEDGWTITSEVKYSAQTVQKLTRQMKLDSVQFMAKARLVGPTHTQLLGKILAHTLGATLTEGTATDLVLSGPSSKTITLKDVELKGAGFEFGGTKLNTGEIGFVTKIDFSSGAPAPSLIFS